MKKVVVGMSGGVDSSVAALLLKNQGYDVIGITYILTDNYDPKDAEEVCKKIDIKHYIIDYRDIFNKEIKQRFISDYESGITPNPCVLCNKKIKFDYLYDFMIKNNCDYIATGHYAKVIDGKLYKSQDINKDQTYFLCEVSKEQLNNVIFPLEGISKDQVREIAKSYNLDVFNKKDSYDVCFITSSFKKYIDNNSNNKPGDILDIDTKKKIGNHIGLSHYTIGQRKGLNVGGNTDRIFVVKKDINKNILYVALGDNNNYLYSNACIIDNINFISDVRPNKCTAKFRYRQNENKVTLEYLNDNEILVKYNKVKTVTPGQVCALYLNDECIGGGIIKKVIDRTEKV